MVEEKYSLIHSVVTHKFSRLLLGEWLEAGFNASVTPLGIGECVRRCARGLGRCEYRQTGTVRFGEVFLL